MPRSAEIPFQITLNPRRLPIFITPQNIDNGMEGGIFQIRGMAAVKSHLLLWRENYPDVLVTFVTVKMIEPALIECDDIGAQAGFVFAFLFDLRNRILACLACRIGRHAGFYGCVYLRGYVFDRYQHIELEIGALISSAFVFA